MYLREINKEIFDDIYLKNNSIYSFDQLCKLFSSELKLDIVDQNIIRKYHSTESQSNQKLISSLGL